MKAEDVRFTDAAHRRGGYALGDIVADLWGAPQEPEKARPIPRRPFRPLNSSGGRWTPMWTGPTPWCGTRRRTV